MLGPLVVRDADTDLPGAGTTLSIISGKADMVDPSISRHIWISTSLRPHPGCVRAYSSCVWTRVAAAGPMLFHRFILKDAVDGDGYWISVWVSNTPDFDTHELVIRRP